MMTAPATTADLAARIFRGRLTISRRQAASALGVGRDYLNALKDAYGSPDLDSDLLGNAGTPEQSVQDSLAFPEDEA